MIKNDKKFEIMLAISENYSRMSAGKYAGIA